MRRPRPPGPGGAPRSPRRAAADGPRGGFARLGRVGEFLGFALAGGIAYAVDLGLFVWLRGPGGLGPLTAKAVSFLAGCAVAYVGNALGTYRRRRAPTRTARARRYGVFFAVSCAGALVQFGCLGFSHYVLGFTAPFDDVVSGAGIGMVLATALRFWGTRTLVFRSERAAGPPGVTEAGEGSRPTWTG